MAQAEFRETLSVEPKKLLEVITGYDSYPEFVDGCRSATMTRSPQSDLIRVSYQVSVMSQDVTYTLDHRHDLKSGRVDWVLVESNFFKKNTGRWEVRPTAQGKSDVLYTLEVDFKVPVPGFILNRLVKGSLPGMVRSFEKRANSV